MRKDHTGVHPYNFSGHEKLLVGITKDVPPVIIIFNYSF